MSALQLLNDPSVTVLAGSGLLDTATEKLNSLEGLLRLFAGVAGIGFVIFQAIQSRGAMSRIVISGLAAAVFVWIVFNVTDLRDRVDSEINASASSQPVSAPQTTTGARPASP